MTTTKLDDTPLTLTLPAYAWAALRGAARAAARSSARKATRAHDLEGINISRVRADTLEAAVKQIEGLLEPTGLSANRR